MNQGQKININTYCLMLVLMIAIALALKAIDISTPWQKAGLINLSIGFLLLIAYVVARILHTVKLPLISGYIFTGIVAGPFVTNFISTEMVNQLRLIDDLALSFIALTAGGALQMSALKERGWSISLNALLLTVMVFGLVFLFMTTVGRQFQTIQVIIPLHLTVLAILLGVISVARSPSSAIAIISECQAEGPFTETVLGVTIVMDVLIILLFTIAMTISKILISSGAALDYHALFGLFFELFAAIFFGAILGKGISYYINRVKHDLFLFLLFIAFGVSKTSFWLTQFMQNYFQAHLHIEPLIICMSAGFVVQNFGPAGPYFMKSLHRMSLPIFVLFFTLAGASLNLNSLVLCWPLALCLVIVRAGGIFCGTWVSAVLTRSPKIHSKVAWMAYLTQAGVAIGLAKMARQEFKLIGDYLNTIVLAVIAINQVLGPITFKAALNIVKESKQ